MSKKTVQYISASQIGQFLYCPVSYKYLYVDGIKLVNRGNIYMSYGSAIHKALAFNYEQKIKSRKDLGWKEVHNEFLKSFSKECTKLRFSEESPIAKEMKIVSEDSLERYMKVMAPKIQPTHVEYKVQVTLKNYPIVLLAIIDVIDENGWVIDHKTASKNTLRNWKQASVDTNLQLTLYTAIYRKLFGKKEAGVRIDLVPRIMGKDPYSISSQRSDQQVIEVLELATRIEKIIELGVFHVNHKSCSTCPFNKECKKLPIIDI